MIKKHIWLIALTSILVVLLAACTPLPTPAPPTITPTILPTYTAAPSLSPAPPSTETLVPSPTPVPVVRFAVIGDYGEEGEDLAAVADLIDSWEVDFIITTGDNNYPIGAPDTIDANIGQYFHEYIYPYKGEYGEGAEVNRFFPSLGNHDWVWVGAEPYLDYFELPGNERYYSFRWDFVDFFALDSDTAEPDGVGRTSPQAEWLQAELAASDAPWQVVYFHHAPYSSGHHGPTDYMQWPFEEWGADVIFSGHDHTYERLRVDDLLYFVVGISGRSRYDIYDPYPGSEFRYREEYGALLVEAIPTEMRFWFYNIEGELIDSMILLQPDWYQELNTPVEQPPKSQEMLDIEQVILENLQTNGGCDLPCWWGIDPRTNTWNEAVEYFNPFTEILNDDAPVTEGYLEFKTIADPPGVLVNVLMSGDQEIEKIEVITAQRNYQYKEPNEKDRDQYLEAVGNYRIENILKKYGKPEEIWIRSFTPRWDWFDTHTLLYYPDLGIVIDYSSESGLARIKDEDYTSSCPNRGDITLQLFDPNTNSTLVKITDWLLPLHKYMKLEEATDLSIEDFVQIFRSPNCKTPLLTPSDLWPSEYDDNCRDNCP